MGFKSEFRISFLVENNSFQKFSLSAWMAERPPLSWMEDFWLSTIGVMGKSETAKLGLPRNAHFAREPASNLQTTTTNLHENRRH